MEETIFQVEVKLQDAVPKISRKVLVEKSCLLSDFAYILMSLFQMEGTHLFGYREPCQSNYWKFIKKEHPEMERKGFIFPEKLKKQQFYTIKNHYTEEFDDKSHKNVLESYLKDIFNTVGQKLFFMYDFGDGWCVEITLKKSFAKESLKIKEFPYILEGVGYGIIEDCGGVYFLNDFMAGEVSQQDLEWHGLENSFFSEHKFDLVEQNELLLSQTKQLKVAYEV